jgi:hypothetical protein
MEIVSKRMGRTYTSIEQIRTVCQLIFHMVSRSYVVFAVGWIQGDDTVQGGTGWGVELAKFFNRPVSVFDQARHGWFTWKDGHWAADTPTIPERPFAATGTRSLSGEGPAGDRGALRALVRGREVARRTPAAELRQRPREGHMRGLMMDRPLLVSSLLEHAAEVFGGVQIVSRTVEGPVVRHTWTDLRRRSAQLAQALEALTLREATPWPRSRGTPTGTWSCTTASPDWAPSSTR